MRDLKELDKYRDFEGEKIIFGNMPPMANYFGGAFFIPTKGARRGMKVVASSGLIPISNGWDHLSVSLPNRTPTWEEMCRVKDLFFHPHEVCFQLHPAQSENISNHRFCLHIWRNIHQDIPLPPPSMVGIKEMGEIKEGGISIDGVRQAQDMAIRDLMK